MTSIVKIFLALALFFVTVVYLYSNTPADNDKVTALVEKAGQHEGAKSLVARFLSETPTPTVGEVVHINGEIEKIFVNETANKAVSDAGLKPVKKEVEPENELDRMSHLLSMIVFFIAGVGIVLAMIGACIRGKTGR